MFTQDTLQPSFISKKIALSTAESLTNIHFLRYFSPFLTVSEISNISNKYWLPYKSATKMLLHKTPDTAPSFQ